MRHEVRGTAGFLLLRRAAVAVVAGAGFFAGALAGVLADAAAAAGCLAGAFFWAGWVESPPAQASAAMAQAAAKVTIFRMISGLVYQVAQTKRQKNSGLR